MRWIKLHDIINLAIFGGLLPLSWLVPLRRWPQVARRLALWHIRLIGSSLRSGSERMRVELGRDPHQIELAFRQHSYLELMEILREHAPGGWQVPISVSGTQHIDDALAAGKGAILWYCPFTHGDLVFKRGICEAGYRLHHLSAITHGFSGTRFGMRFLNTIKTSVEERYLEERLILDGKDSRPTLQALRERLQDNGLVSITAVHTGKRVAYAGIFGGKLQLATGAPNQAIRTGAALLPLFVFPKDGGYHLRIEAPLLGQATKEQVKEEDYVTAYAPILERHVREHPELWPGWFAFKHHWRYEPNQRSEESAAAAASVG